MKKTNNGFTLADMLDPEQARKLQKLAGAPKKTPSRRRNTRKHSPGGE